MENKNSYENVIIIKGTFTEEEYKQALNKIKDKVKELAELEKIEEIGLKKLAYEVKKNRTGYYVIIYFKSTSQDVLELERYYRINDDVLKFIIVKQ